MSGIVMKSDGYLYVHRVMVDEKFWPMFEKGSDWMPVHRYVVAKHFGRCLTSEESVHHVDFDRLNNVIENLEVMSREEHRRIHAETKGSVEIVVEKRQKTVMPNTQIAKVLGVSLSDFRSGFCQGADFTYVMAPKGVVPLSEVLKGVGLVEVDVERVRVQIEPVIGVVGAVVVKKSTFMMDSRFKTLDAHQKYVTDLIARIAARNTIENMRGLL